MGSRLILVIVLAAVLLAGADVGGATKKFPVQADKAQTAVTKAARLQAPETQPHTAGTPTSSAETASPVSLTAGPTSINTSPQTGEQINWQVLASGGGTQTLGTLVLGSTIGQTAAGWSSVGSYSLQSGFWQNFGGGYLCGDIDHSGDVNVADVVYLVAYIFSGGPAPDPMVSADVDCSGDINIADAVYTIEYIFTHGAAPCAACS